MTTTYAALARRRHTQMTTPAQKTAAAHVTVFRTPVSGVAHAYTACAGAGRHAGHLTAETLTVAALTAEPPGKICACLRHRWGAYRQDLGLAPRFTYQHGRTDQP